MIRSSMHLQTNFVNLGLEIEDFSREYLNPVQVVSTLATIRPMGVLTDIL